MHDRDEKAPIPNWLRVGSQEWTREQHKDYLIRALAKTEHELDNLTVVVVGGTLLEYYLRRLIAAKASLSILEPKGRTPVPFGMLVRIAQSTEVLPDSLAKPLRALMKLRNKYAHEIAYKLKASDIRALRASVEDTWMEEDWEELEAGPPESPTKEKRTVGFHLRAFIVCVADALLYYIDYRSGSTSPNSTDLGFDR